MIEGFRAEGIDTLVLGCTTPGGREAVRRHLIRALKDMQNKIEEQGIDGRKPREPVFIGE